MAIRVLIVDDSAFNRQAIAQILTDAGAQVVGRAGDGDEALKLAFQLAPDLITLDLEMPRMDGFSFLRLLMARQPTPVIVVSSNAGRENVFKALELGALDFVQKPQKQVSQELLGIRDELVAKLQLVTKLRMITLTDRATRRDSTMSGAFRAIPQKAGEAVVSPTKLVAIGASTGGPPAITQILGALDPAMPAGIVITQHMPTRFTRAFAERLDRVTPFRVKEAEGDEALSVGTVLVAPGSGSLILRKEAGILRAQVVAPEPTDRFVPSVDRMLESAARAAGADCLAVILTGMGGDGGRGSRVIKERGGRVVVESAETAVIFGMPQEAIAAGSVDEIVPLPQIPEAIGRFVRKSS